MFKTLTLATTSLLVLTNVTRGEEGGEWPNPYPYYNDNGASSLRRQIDGDYGGSYGYTPNPLAHPALFPALLFSSAGVSIFHVN